MASDATLYPRHDAIMAVIAKATARRYRRNHMRGLFEARLTREQLLADLRKAHAAYGLPCRGSLRSVSYWLKAMERLRFFRRTIVEQRDGLGRIRWKLIQFSFGPVGISWIKQNRPNALAGVSRSIVQKIAARFEKNTKDLKLATNPQPKNAAACGQSSPPLARGESTAPKSAALRRRTSSSATGRARRAPKAASRPPVRKGAGRPATIAQAARKGSGRGRRASFGERRSKRATARRSAIPARRAGKRR